MDISIGVQFAPRELHLEVDSAPEDLRKVVDEAVEEGRKILWVTDRSGKQVGVPLDKLAYIQLATEKSDKKVGFAARTDEED